MTAYAVGDLQGCLTPLLTLLKQVGFDQHSDELWLVGDLVNRGPESLAALRFVKSLGSSARVVLGNHDLHLLAVAHGIRAASRGDTLQDILAAPDAAELLDWLRCQPLIHHDSQRALVMVHAGFPHIWTRSEACEHAAEVSKVLQSEQLKDFLQHMYGNEPACWTPELAGFERLRVITNYLTRMRFCTQAGELDLRVKDTTQHPDPRFRPWFEWHTPPAARQDSDNSEVIFGHWAALEAHCAQPGFHALDSGCVWGRCLTLMNLDTRQRHHCDCNAAPAR